MPRDPRPSPRAPSRGGRTARESARGGRVGRDRRIQASPFRVEQSGAKKLAEIALAIGRLM